MNRNVVLGVVALAVTVMSVGCARKAPVLNVYNWADYIDEDQIAAFEKEFGCRVVIDTFDANESMYAKLKAGATGYDVIFPSGYMSKTLNEQGMLLPLDHARLANLGNVDPAIAPMLLDKRQVYSVPYCFSYTGIGYRKDKVTDPKASWDLFLDPAFAGRATLVNDVREVLGAALLRLGYSVNTTNEAQIEAAADLAIQWKKNIAKFDSEQYKTGLDSGEFTICQGYSMDILMVAAENENIGILTPEEGMAVCCDDMVIPVTADNVELAYAFIDFMLRPEVAAANTEWNLAQIPNAAAYELLEDDTRGNPAIFLSPETLAKCEVLTDVGDAIARYSKAWDRIKAAE